MRFLCFEYFITKHSIKTITEYESNNTLISDIYEEVCNINPHTRFDFTGFGILIYNIHEGYFDDLLNSEFDSTLLYLKSILKDISCKEYDHDFTLRGCDAISDKGVNIYHV